MCLQGGIRGNRIITSRCWGLRAVSCPRENPYFFQNKCDFFFFSVHFLPSVSLEQALVEARGSYNGFGISRSLIFYFAVAGALWPAVWDTDCHSEVSGTRLLGWLDKSIFWFGRVMNSLNLTTESKHTPCQILHRAGFLLSFEITVCCCVNKIYCFSFCWTQRRYLETKKDSLNHTNHHQFSILHSAR